jgi:hypothetical protein
LCISHSVLLFLRLHPHVLAMFTLTSFVFTKHTRYIQVRPLKQRQFSLRRRSLVELEAETTDSPLDNIEDLLVKVRGVKKRNEKKK